MPLAVQDLRTGFHPPIVPYSLTYLQQAARFRAEERACCLPVRRRDAAAVAQEKQFGKALKGARP